MQPTAKRRVVFRCLLVVGSFLFAIATTETVVRLMGQVDVDGNFSFQGQAVGHRVPPVTAITETLAKYQTTSITRMIYDAETGWRPRPHISTHGGNYRYNARGIRSPPKKYDLQPADGTLRIALFGDSFTHGDDVPFDDTWGAMLEEKLNALGIAAEVINFGVSAYGMDQAFLRWQTLGRSYSPHIVLFGFQAENVNRNVNMLRAFYAGGTGIPFSKPRFVLDDDGTLRLINSPTLSLDRVPKVMANMDSWKLAKYETFYDKARFAKRFWHCSRALSLAVERLSDNEPSRRIAPYRLEGELARVTLALLSEFRRDVERHNAEFYIVHLPKESDLDRLLENRGCAYQQLLERVSEQQIVIDPQPRLLNAARADSLESLYQRHYSPKGNGIITEVITNILATTLADKR
ncbi:MAG: hypothetical protein HON53_22225 [Planctomycetaceae bacterium]|nr:hypothetical protein [Planctomycetaceae bacterium]